jgi:LPXTG-motif cell wall-anchored protein
VALVNTTFKAKAAGTSGINLDDSYLESPQRIQIAGTLAGGSVTVRAAPTATAPPTTATATAVATSSATPALSATAASGTSTSIPSAATAVSTNAAGAALSNVEAPTTGSGAAGQSGAAWWIPTLTAVGAAMLGIGGLAVWRRRRRA